MVPAEGSVFEAAGAGSPHPAPTREEAGEQWLGSWVGWVILDIYLVGAWEPDDPLSRLDAVSSLLRCSW